MRGFWSKRSKITAQPPFQRTWLRQGGKRRKKCKSSLAKAAFGFKTPSPLNKSLGALIQNNALFDLSSSEILYSRFGGGEG